MEGMGGVGLSQAQRHLIFAGPGQDLHGAWAQALLLPPPHPAGATVP